MELLSVRDLCKTYPGFTLDRISFSLESGYIMGFIGRNGAGKTTTLKSMLGLVHPDGGAVEMFGMDFRKKESACRQQLGVVLGDARYYGSKSLRDVAAVTARFYECWDDDAYRVYMKRFSLDESKRVRELSTGMWVKFTLALALSHGARLLVLDEPTSGLDPVSRDELLDIFRDTVANGERSILFSTHIISDLEKCADLITYIHAGKILTSTDRDSFTDDYRKVTGGRGELTDAVRESAIGLREQSFGFEAMMKTEDAISSGLAAEPIGMEEIMIHIEREGRE